MANLLLAHAAHQSPATTKRGALERLFTLMFQGFVYNQIWEDPDVDLEALELQPHHRLHHHRLGRLQCPELSGGRSGQDHGCRSQPQSHRADAIEARSAGKSSVLRGVLPLLRRGQRQGQSRSSTTISCASGWIAKRGAIGKSTCPLHGRRINMFARNLYRYGLLGRFIGMLHDAGAAARQEA